MPRQALARPQKPGPDPSADRRSQVRIRTRSDTLALAAMADEALTDLEVFDRWRRGEAAMGKLFFQRMGPRLMAYFRRNVYDRSTVEELVHETFIECMRTSGTAVANPRAYLFGIASHLFSRHIRRKRRELGRIDGDPEALGLRCDFAQFGELLT